jgi:hypothetical protein
LIDLFQFALAVREFVPGRELEFCVCFRTQRGIEYWDNNFARNYKVMVVEGVRKCEVSLAELSIEKENRSVSPYW